MEWIWIVVAAVIGLAAGAAVATALVRARADAAQSAAIGALERDRAGLEATVQGLEMQLDESRTRVTALEERARADATAHERRERGDSQVAQQLAPVREAVVRMQSQLVELERQRSEQHGSIAQQLHASLESEERLRRSADSLAGALVSNSTRGVWGETQLRRVVEAAGLIERVDFDTQVSHETVDGRIRPDMVVHLPGGTHIVVDAKVPFAAYLEASAIPLTASPDELARRSQLMQQHVRAIRAHVDQLSKKQYWAGVGGSPEFVVAFIPSESLVSAALEADPSLMDDAFAKRVALASPVTLWSVLKSVALTWSQASVADDARAVHDTGLELYDRIAKIAEHADRLRASIESTVKSYNQFASSLETRVLVTARRLSRMDAPTPIAEPRAIESQPRILTAAEMTAAAPTEPRPDELA